MEGVEIIAKGRDSWIGWVELAIEPVDERAIRMTARVINDLAAIFLGSLLQQLGRTLPHHCGQSKVYAAG